MKFKLIDANSETLEVSMSEITDVNTDAADEEVTNLNDSDSSQLDFAPEIVDYDGASIKIEDAIKMLDSEGSGVIALDVTFEATHSGVNSNSCNYVGDSLEKDAKSWMYPYPKPFLKNHDMSTEPIGRVKASSYGSSIFDSEKNCIDVEFRVTDKDAMNKFIDGRYKTMSIGGSARNIKCDICSKDIVKDGILNFCGHWKGKVYDNKKATWTCTDIDYHEGSVVNNPADKWAQVKKIAIIKTSENKDASEGTVESTDSVEDSSIDNEIDNALNLSNVDTAVSDVSDGAANSEPSDTDETVEDSAEANDLTQELQDAKMQLESKSEEVKELTDKLEKATSDNAALNSSILDLEITLKANKDSFIKLALEHRKGLCERIADNELLNSKLLDSKYSERVDELCKFKTAELKDMLLESKKNKSYISVAPVTSNGIVDGNVTDEEDKKEAVKTKYSDLEDSIIESILNK